MKINNMSNDELTYSLLKKGLDATSTRSKAIADNLANINTKGYKRKYVTFEETLKNNMNSNELKTTNNKHIKINGEAGEIQVKTDTSSSMRTDGNNVDIDSEMVNQSANSLMYNALITQTNSRIAMERIVVNGR